LIDGLGKSISIEVWRLQQFVDLAEGLHNELVNGYGLGGTLGIPSTVLFPLDKRRRRDADLFAYILLWHTLHVEQVSIFVFLRM